MSILDRVRPDLAGFVPYASARRTGLVAPTRLDANESPWPHDDAAPLNRYPEPQPAALRDALARLYGVRSDQLWIGRGSDEAIDLLVRAFCRAQRDNIVSIVPTFGMYKVAARLQGANWRELPLRADEDFALDPVRLLACVDDDTRIVVLCSPNNPTGTCHHAHIETLARALHGRALLLVDEAYIEFSDSKSAASLIDRYDNLAVLRTLSKAHALAGARIGALLASAPLVALVSAIAAPYPVSTPCTVAALRALEPVALAETMRRVTTLVAERNRLAAALAASPAVSQVWPAAGNSLLVRWHDAARSFARLLGAGVLVRDVSAQTGLDGCLRISVGSPAQNDQVLAALGGRIAA